MTKAKCCQIMGENVSNYEWGDKLFPEVVHLLHMISLKEYHMRDGSPMPSLSTENVNI